jgi:MFS family permease
MVVADVVRTVAFAGIVVVDGFVPTVLLALVAGIGTGLFTPSALAALPSVSGRARLPAASSLYGAVMDFGFIAGPGFAALFLLVGPAETILAVNAASYAVSAVILAPLGFGAAPESPGTEERPGLLREARAGLRATTGMAGLRIVLVASAAVLCFGAIFNVGELLLVKEELGGGNVGFAVLLTLEGSGFILGSLSGSRGGLPSELKRRYLLGAFLAGVGIVASGLAPILLAAAVAFVAAGYANGLMLVYERLLIQHMVPDALSGRVFGVKDGLTAWAFAVGFLVGPPLLATVGTRTMLVAAGIGALCAWAVAAVGLRGWWVAEPEPLPGDLGADLAARAGPGEQGSYLVRS